MSKIACEGWRYTRCGPIARVLKLEKFESSVGSGDVVVRINRAPLHRTDSALINGTACGRVVVDFPRLGGFEGVGTVVRSGSASGLKEGDLVWVGGGSGTWGDKIVHSGGFIHKIKQSNAALATFASNLLLAQLLVGKCTAGDVVVQNGGSSFTAAAVAALGQAKKVTVLSVASSGDRFLDAEGRLRTFGSPLFSNDARGFRAASVKGEVKAFFNAVGGRSFNDGVKLVKKNGLIVNFGAQNGFGLSWAGSHHIYRQLSMEGLYLPTALQAMTAVQRQAALDEALEQLTAKGFQYPVEEARGLSALPKVWDSVFVKGGSKGVLVL